MVADNIATQKAKTLQTTDNALSLFSRNIPVQAPGLLIEWLLEHQNFHQITLFQEFLKYKLALVNHIHLEEPRSDRSILMMNLTKYLQR